MPLSRRRFLGAAAAVATTGVLARPFGGLASTPARVTFGHGVASGDPLADRVILWTRVTPLPGEQGPFPVIWRIASDPDLVQTVAEGVFETGAERDYTVKVDAAGLEPGTTYWYGFESVGALSMTGRTRTAPVHAEQLRFAATTCNNPAVNYEDTYLHLAEVDDLAAVIHTGDYIYDHGSAFWNGGRIHTVDEYRHRHAWYKARQPSIAAHAAHPWVILWDDGDIVGGASVEAAYTHEPERMDYETHAANAVRVFDEWTPTRLDVHSLDKVAWEETYRRPLPRWLESHQLYRRLPFGDLADVVKLDVLIEGRHDNRGDSIVTYNSRELDAEDRRMISPTQRAWLGDQLEGSRAQWKLVLSQTLFGHWAATPLPRLPNEVHDFLGIREHGNPFYSSSWNGYPAERRRVIRDALSRSENNVLVSGDAHLSFAMDLAEDPYDPVTYDRTGRGSVGVEFCTPSVNSEAFPETLGYPARTASVALEHASVVANPHHRWCEFDSAGYTLVDLTPDRARGEFWFVDRTPATQSHPLGYRPSAKHLAAAFETEAGSDHVQQVLLDL
jgi:alkaline phosphatase D